MYSWRPRNILGQIKVPTEDAKLRDFYDRAERIMTEGVFIPDGIQIIDIYFDVDANTENLNLLLINICIPNTNAKTYISETGPWNFASEYRTIGAIDLELILAKIKIGALRKVAKKSLRRLWLRFGIEVGIDINTTVSWISNGYQIKADGDFNSTRLASKNLELPSQLLANEFRDPI
ncbi:hypothetical protein OCU04_001076 [Sclerotinia nivalis]|uniref:Uncharacterized protein n=1 Tax=Sclerotinia nivalis TaxID=352851 RepID=A0A9X0AXV6_9HELO|nr:hypothetical protein OCU04_001076 [Sclerotinia nivalis]